VSAELWTAAREGEPPLVVLIHGSMDRSASFIRAERHLEGRHVLRYDRRGYGRSVGTGPAATFDDHVDDLLAIVDGRPAVAVGHSLGGVVALAAAQRRPDLIMAVGAFESPRPWVDWWPTTSAGTEAMAAAESPEDAAEVFMRRMIGDDRWEALPAKARADRRREGPAFLAEMVALRRPPPPYDAESVPVPVVVGRGSESTGHHRRTTEELVALVPDGELFVIEGARHGAHSSHPAEFAAFVERVVARAAGRS
jgi:pimeloyl-ACP methyl ester carboxylesterase